MLISKLSVSQREAIGVRLREALEMTGTTQEALASHLGVDPRTVRNMLNGKGLKLHRLRKACEFLGVAFSTLETAADARALGSAEIADETLGSYHKNSVAKLLGDHCMARHAFGSDGVIHFSRLSFSWNAEIPALKFSEENRFKGLDGIDRNYSQSGLVHVSSDIGLIHLLTRFSGALRLVTLCKPRLDTGFMYGTILTQADHSLGFQPAVSPVFVGSVAQLAELDARQPGPVTASCPEFDMLEKQLDLAVKQFTLIKTGI